MDLVSLKITSVQLALAALAALGLWHFGSYSPWWSIGLAVLGVLVLPGVLIMIVLAARYFIRGED